MRNPIEQTEFWKKRLEDAEKVGKDYLSVYNTSPADWDYICAVHKKICSYFVTGKVLDIGCGYGRLSEWFPEYVGVDFSPDFIHKARKMYPHAEFVISDIKDMPLFLDKEFDWAVCASVKAMVIREMGEEEWNNMLKEIKRVAKNVLILEYSHPERYEII